MPTDAARETHNEIDARLTRLLVEDGRASYTSLAEHVGLGIDAVQQRVNRLVASGRLTIVGSIAPNAIGYSTSGIVGMRVVGVSAMHVARTVAGMASSHFVASSAGEFDVIVELVCRDNDEFARTCDELRTLDGVAAISTMLYLSIGRFTYTPSPPNSAEASPTAPQLDARDIAIASALRSDGRASYSTLAAAAGLSDASARRRTLRLFDAGIVRINTLINPFLSDTRTVAMVGFKVSGSTRPILAQLQDFAPAGMITAVTGRYNVLVELTCASRGEIVDAVSAIVDAAAGISEYEICQYLSVHKLPPQWAEAPLSESPTVER